MVSNFRGQPPYWHKAVRKAWRKAHMGHASVLTSSRTQWPTFKIFSPVSALAVPQMGRETRGRKRAASCDCCCRSGLSPTWTGQVAKWALLSTSEPLVNAKQVSSKTPSMCQAGVTHEMCVMRRFTSHQCQQNRQQGCTVVYIGHHILFHS